MTCDAYFDRFDICEAYYVYGCLWGGDGYAYANAIGVRLHRLGYQPSCMGGTEADLSANGKAIYGALVRRREPAVVAYDRLHRRARGRVDDALLRNVAGLPPLPHCAQRSLFR